MSLYTIHTGLWTNWSHGAILGATLTLSPRDGALLLSFIAAFVTIVGSRLWNIVSFLWHQALVSKDPQDGLHYQQRSILRNVTSPGGAAWVFLQQAWHWRGRAARSFLRTVPGILLATIYLALFGALAVFSSQISKSAGSERLIKGKECGYWLPVTPVTNVTVRALTQKTAQDARTATTYARACYDVAEAPPQCEILPMSTLNHSNHTNAACPFDQSMCRNGTAFSVQTDALDSQSVLGINAAPSDRILYRRQMSCAPVVLQGYVAYLTGAEAERLGYDNNTLVKYSYGPMLNPNLSNYTYLYNTNSVYANVGYTVSIQHWFRAGNSSWAPITALQPAQGDLDMLFIAFNSMSFEEPCDDPIFSAHMEYQVNSSTGLSTTYYEPDRVVSPMACVTKHQFCNPNTQKCTGEVSSDRLQYDATNIGFTYPQMTTAYRILLALEYTSFPENVGPRMANALRAQDAVSENTQLYLPPNQWQIEANGWFEDSLVRLQYAIQEYAVGPSTLTEGSRLYQPWDESTATSWNQSDTWAAPTWKAQCDSQITHGSQGTMSFSVLGLIITFVIGGIILLLSTCFETLFGMIQQLLKVGEHQRLAWILDSNLQSQRMLYESMGFGTWDGHTDAVPTTVEKERFHSFDPVVEARAGSPAAREEHPATTSDKEAVVQTRPLLERDTSSPTS